MPNSELERQKLLAQIEILERNVADQEQMLRTAYAKLREAQDQLYDCNRIKEQYKIIKSNKKGD